jgi:L-asparaginase II
VDDQPVLIEVERSGLVESVHRGALCALGPDGGVTLALGGPDAVMFPRSSNKPMQATAMVECGLALEGADLALAAASHAGEDFHVAGVRRILDGAGLTEDALQCPADLPLDPDTAHALLRSGGTADRIHMNCSGKHAAMLATCVLRGWPTATYLDPGHPLQKAARDTVERLTGEPVAVTAVDGCGAPLYGFSLLGLARAFRAVVTAAPGTPERKIADAMRAHPAYMSGTHRLDRKLMDAVPGLLVKGGAEAVLACALPDGRAAALKIADGGQRGVRPAAVALLRRIGVTGLDDLAATPVLGGGLPVGEVRAVLP